MAKLIITLTQINDLGTSLPDGEAATRSILPKILLFLFLLERYRPFNRTKTSGNYLAGKQAKPTGGIKI